MSTTPASSQPSSHATGAGHGTQASARAGAHGHRKPGHAETGTDMFSSLMLLLSAGTDVPGLALGAATDGSDSTATLANTPSSDSSAASPTEGGSATLAAMLQWAGRPQTDPANRASGKGGDDRAAAAAASNALGAGTASAADAANPLLQGMKRLDRPEALDAQTLATLATPADGAALEPSTTTPAPEGAGPDVLAAADTPSATQAPANALRAAGNAAVRGHAAPAGTQALQQAHHAQQPSAQAQVSQTQALQDRSATRVEVGPAIALRSTVTLDERFSDAGPRSVDGARADALAVLLPAAQGGGAGPGGQPGQGGEPTTGGHEPPADSHGPEASPDDGARWADDLQSAADERMEAFASPASLRHASLRVGESEKDAIDIQLSLTGQELDLGFRTDNADVRAALAQHADSDLPELLRRGGLQLGDVNVSAQNGERGDDSPARQPGRELPAVARAGSAARGGDVAAPAAPTTPRPPRRDGNRPLDLFV